MARRHFPPSIDRRRFLTSAAAAVTATGSILPGVKRADAAAAPDLFQSPPLTLEVEPGNFCAATARRLVEIALRNALRQEAKLPLLSVPKELRRMKKQEELEEFQPVRGGAWQGIVGGGAQARREAEGNPNWRPNWMEGVRYQSEIYKILRQRFYAARHGVCWGEAVRSRAIRSQSGHIGSCVA